MSNRRLQAVAALVAVGVSGYPSVAFPVLAPTLQAELRLTTGALGALLALGMGGGCVGGLLAGWRAARQGSLHALRATILVCVTGCALVAVGGFVHALLWPALAILGLGSGGAYVAAGGLLASLFPSRRRGSFSGLMVTNAACGIVFPLLVALLDSLHAGGTLALAWVLAGPHALAGAALLGLRHVLARQTEEPPGAHAGLGDRASEGAGRFAVAAIVLLAAIHGTADGVLYSWMPKLLTERFPSGPFPAGWVLSFYSAAYLTGRLALTFLPDSLGRRTLVVVPGLVAGPLVVLALQAPSMYLLAGGYALASLLYGLEFPSLMGLASQRYPDRFPTLFGWVSGTTVVATAGVWGVGRWAQATGSLTPALSVAGCGFLAFGLLAAAWTALDRRWLQARPGAGGAAAGRTNEPSSGVDGRRDHEVE